MNFNQLKAKILDRNSPARLVCLTVGLVLLFFSGRPGLTREELRLYHKVEAAQAFLWDELGRRGLERDEAADTYHSGFIGLEWSMTTTTLGSLEAKRCSTDPLWAVQALRWFDRLGLRRGDKITVLASSSFPGLLYSFLAAAEERGLNVSLGVSLGSSTWGANRPDLPWPLMSGALRRGGFLKTKTAFYTLGGDEENGQGMPVEARELLTRSARGDSNSVFLDNATLEEAVEAKLSLVRGARLLVSVGGSEGNMGRDPAVLGLPSGLILPRSGGGDGVIGRALEEGYPVIHLLNMRGLAGSCGIAWDGRRPGFVRGGPLAALSGLALFIFFMVTHRRWEYKI